MTHLCGTSVHPAIVMLTEEERLASVAQTDAPAAPKPRRALPAPTSKTVGMLANITIAGEYSRYKGLAPAGGPTQPPAALFSALAAAKLSRPENAKAVLDRDGPAAMAAWVRAQPNVLITDTTMRDAHQSLLATRVRTEDLLAGCNEA